MSFYIKKVFVFVYVQNVVWENGKYSEEKKYHDS